METFQYLNLSVISKGRNKSVKAPYYGYKTDMEHDIPKDFLIHLNWRFLKM